MGMVKLGMLSLMVLNLAYAKEAAIKDADFKLWHKVEGAEKCELVKSLDGMKEAEKKTAIEEASKMLSEKKFAEFIEKFESEPRLFVEMLRSHLSETLKAVDKNDGEALRIAEKLSEEVMKGLSSSLEKSDLFDAYHPLMLAIADMTSKELESDSLIHTLFPKDNELRLAKFALSLEGDKGLCVLKTEEPKPELKAENEDPATDDNEVKGGAPVAETGAGEQEAGVDDAAQKAWQQFCDQLNGQFAGVPKAIADSIDKTVTPLKNALNDVLAGLAKKENVAQPAQVAQNRNQNQQDPIADLLNGVLNGLKNEREQAQNLADRRDNDTPFVQPQNDDNDEPSVLDQQVPQITPPQPPTLPVVPAVVTSGDNQKIATQLPKGVSSLSSSKEDTESARKKAEQEGKKVDSMLSQVNVQQTAAFGPFAVASEIERLTREQGNLENKKNQWVADADSKRKQANRVLEFITAKQGDARSLLDPITVQEENRLKQQSKDIQSEIQRISSANDPANAPQIQMLQGQLQQAKSAEQDFGTLVAQQLKQVAPQIELYQKQADELLTEAKKLEEAANGLDEKKTAIQGVVNQFKSVTAAQTQPQGTITRNIGERVQNTPTSGGRTRALPTSLGVGDAKEVRGSIRAK